MFIFEGFIFNYVGGVLGGIFIGQDIEVYMVFKLILSILVFGKIINKDNEEIDIVIKGCYDLCVGICVVFIVEVMLVLVLMDYLLCYCV